MPGIIHNRVLLIGFESNVSLPPYFRELFGTAEEIRAKLDADHARIQRAGIATVVFQLSPLEQEKGLRDLQGVLREGQYDAIGIGAGVRIHPDYAHLFETIVNMCGMAVPGVPLMFNDGPGGTVETIERVLGERIP
ncbi:hypothetical protein SAMD00023353_3500490 [Rosellinia necatrix]|uniref:Uncharacterized protein n=1 Tax=Rosellinia necatrix TaxID=77044 RepID=A0A1W2TMT1_ROSNE|nr:hypothetical protein SAMD00023353_3500490 [Rosellinia necatrix]